MTNARVSGLLGVMVLVLSANGCGDIGEPTESVSGSILNQWTPWFSDAYPWGIQNCNPSNDRAAVMGVKCSGSYCDNMSLYCSSYLPLGFTPVNPPGPVAPAGFISEESPNNVQYCPTGTIMYGMQTTGSYSDNIQLSCMPVNFPPQGLTCRWTNWFSEEQGTQYFDADLFRPGGAVAIAVMCSGSYCDNMSFLACEPRCTSDADCGGNFCSTTNHWCVIG